MTTLREAAQQALEALHSVEYHDRSSISMLDDCKVEDAITALRAALAEPNYWEEEARRYASNADYWRKRCVSCGGALPATGQDDRTGECVCGEPTALNTVHRTDGPCYVAEPVQEPVRRLTDAQIGEIWFQAKLPGVPEYAARVLIRAAEQVASSRPFNPHPPSELHGY